MLRCQLLRPGRSRSDCPARTPYCTALNHFARLVRRGAVGQVPARGEVHPKDGVAGLYQRLHDALIGLTARVRLDVGKARSQTMFGAVDGEIFRDINNWQPP